MPISTVDFGRLDAESDTNLQSYFVDTGVLAKLRDGRKHYVIGRKGSGKTALFKLATTASLAQDVVTLDFADYPWETHKQIREAGLAAEASYVASWRFFLLSQICRHWSQSNSIAPELKRSSAALIKRAFPDGDPGLFEILFDKLKRLRKLALPEITGLGKLGGFELEPTGDNAGGALAQAGSQWTRLLSQHIEGHYAAAPVTLTLDRLDDGWDATEESRLLLVGVLKATREINTSLLRQGHAAAVIVFLRSDIYNELSFNDKNKIFADVEFLEWSETRLVSVIEKRIAASLNLPEKDSWWVVFSNDEMRQRARTQSYILKRTMGRPRDIVAFSKNCQEVAGDAKHDVVMTADVYTAEERYSRHIYDELDDEMHKQLPEARTHLQALRDLGRVRFSLNEWHENLKKRDSSIKIEEARRRLKILFDYSIVGVPKAGGARGGSGVQFVYNDRLIVPDFGQKLTVHASLKKHLGLRE